MPRLLVPAAHVVVGVFVRRPLDDQRRRGGQAFDEDAEAGAARLGMATSIE